MDAPPPFLLLLPLAVVGGGEVATAATVHPGDLTVLEDLRRSLTNLEVLAWPKGADPCGGGWSQVSCDRAGRVNNLDLKGVGLAGALPDTFSSLDALQDLSLQTNKLSGPLPSFRGMAALRHAYLNDNAFDALPADFSDGLDSLEEICLDNNPLNRSADGREVPATLATSSPQLMSLRLVNCNLVGGIPGFLGGMSGLQMLTLSYNKLSGPTPDAFAGSGLQKLWINNQLGETKLSGTLDVLAGMTHLQQAWLHGNQFAGPIPDGISNCKQLAALYLNSNNLVGLVPPGLAALRYRCLRTG